MNPLKNLRLFKSLQYTPYNTLDIAAIWYYFLQMKTIIVFATKYGAAKEVAKLIAENIEGSAMHDLSDKNVPSINDYECVILGSSIYAGRIRGEAKAFLEKNSKILPEKTLGFFISGLDLTREKEFFEANIPSDLLQKAKAASTLGGIFDPKKANFFERFIIKMITKTSAVTNTINEGKIKQFAEKMKS